ncbi:hypothetical protein GCM10027020_09610 [Nocardioides salsibiostraticola]
MENHLDAVRSASQGLVHAVVDDLPETVHQTTRVGGSDVHARPLANGLETLEDQQVRGVVGVVADRELLEMRSSVRWDARQVPNLPATRDALLVPRCAVEHHGGLGWGRRSVLAAPTLHLDAAGYHEDEAIG